MRGLAARCLMAQADIAHLVGDQSCLVTAWEAEMMAFADGAVSEATDAEVPRCSLMTLVCVRLTSMVARSVRTQKALPAMAVGTGVATSAAPVTTTAKVSEMDFVPTVLPKRKLPLRKTCMIS